LVDGTPKLIASGDFECAVPAEAQQQFEEALRSDFTSGVSTLVAMMLPELDAGDNREMLLRICNQSDPKVALSHLASAGKRDLRDKLPHIISPTLVMCGDLDTFCPPQASECLAAGIPKALLHFFPGKGHAPFLTDADNFNSILSGFLKQPNEPN
jgi:pimeloyl-[acyl-carrier protein] methyl ester esterase